MNILITGSSGTIGTRLYERLLAGHAGDRIIGLDIRDSQWQPSYNERLYHIDLRRPEELARLEEPIDMVVHLAANARVYDLVETPALAFDNMMTTFNTLEYMRKRQIRKIILASSSETYGNIMAGEAIAENRVALENCESPYAASKITGEALLHAYRRAYGIDGVIVRFSNVYGMYDDSNRVIPLWIRQCLRNEDLVVFGKDKSLDFTYIDDAVTGVVSIIDRFDRVKGDTFNIASGEEVSLVAVAEMIRQRLVAHNGITMGSNRPGEVWKYRADITRARERLGFTPTVGIEAGMTKTIAWYLARAAAAAP